MNAINYIKKQRSTTSTSRVEKIKASFLGILPILIDTYNSYKTGKKFDMGKQEDVALYHLSKIFKLVEKGNDLQMQHDIKILCKAFNIFGITALCSFRKKDENIIFDFYYTDLIEHSLKTFDKLNIPKPERILESFYIEEVKE